MTMQSEDSPQTAASLSTQVANVLEWLREGGNGDIADLLVECQQRLDAQAKALHRLEDEMRRESPAAWKAAYKFHGMDRHSLHGSATEAMKVLDETRGPAYSHHEIVALFKRNPWEWADQIAATLRGGA